MELKHNSNCPNRNCEGGVIYTTGRACRKCNPELSKEKIKIVKKTYTRDEVEYLLKKLHYQCCLEYPITLNCNIWIKDNLK